MTEKKQVVVVQYMVASRFRVPEGLDAEKLIADGDLYVMWDIMHIKVNGEWKQIKPHTGDGEDNINWKYGDNMTIDDYNSCIDGESESESESENESETVTVTSSDDGSFKRVVKTVHRLDVQTNS